MARKKKRKVTAWNEFFGAAKTVCANDTATNRKKLSDAEKKYRASAKRKGKTKAQIDKSVRNAKKCNLK